MATADGYGRLEEVLWRFGFRFHNTLEIRHARLQSTVKQTEKQSTSVISMGNEPIGIIYDVVARLESDPARWLAQCG